MVIMLTDFTLYISGSEWFIIFILIIFLIFPKKISGISKSIGKVIGEYEKTREKLMNEKNALQQQARGGNSSGHDSISNANGNVGIGNDYHIYRGPNIQTPVASERQKLETIAKSLGIVDVEYKKDEELRRLITSKFDDSGIGHHSNDNNDVSSSSSSLSK